LLEAGSDTTSTFLQTFVLLMTAHPDAQKKLQEEMDRVVGPERVPNPNDFEHLPYLQVVWTPSVSGCRLLVHSGIH
jgi:cytochrome P450